jgi:hypothetical protein
MSNLLEKYNVIEELLIENFRLEKENRDLRQKLETENSIENFILALREEYYNVWELYKIKKKILKNLRFKKRIYIEKLKQINLEFCEFKNLKEILSEEINTDNKIISDLKIKINQQDEILNKLSEEFENLDQEYNQNEKEYYTLAMKKTDLNFKLKILEDKIENQKLAEKESEERIKQISLKLNKNKNIFEKTEKDLNNSLYFIRFSNSLVRSFFNIINVRRIQIKMLQNGKKNENYNFLFTKLEDLEQSLITEYTDFQNLIF